jgi:hypothetical protein
MGAAECVDTLGEWQLGWRLMQRILFATTAALAIDWAHVQLVVHAGPPTSVLEYAHETGRAGRNGQPARCVTLVPHGWQPPPLSLQAAAWQRNDWQTLAALFCATPTPACRWQRLTVYLDGDGGVTPCDASSRHACNACRPTGLDPSSGMPSLLRTPPTASYGRGASYGPAAESPPPCLAALLSGCHLPAPLPPPPIFSSPISARHPTASTAASGARPVDFTSTPPAYAVSCAASSAMSPLLRHAAPSAFMAAEAAERSSVHGSSDG